MGVIVWHGIFFVNVVGMCQLFCNICGIYYISYLKYHARCLIYNSNHNFNIYSLIKSTYTIGTCKYILINIQYPFT